MANNPSFQPLPEHFENYHKDACTSIFIAALFTVAQTSKQLKCPLIGEWRKKLWHIHTMEFCSAIGKDEILSFASTLVALKNIMLSKMSDSKSQELCDV